MERNTRRWFFDLTVWTAGALTIVLLGAEIGTALSGHTPGVGVVGGVRDAPAAHSRG
jgi:hypothetical protein